MNRRIQGAAVSAGRTESPWMFAVSAVDFDELFSARESGHRA
jgi:hypothetical protein